MYGEHRRPEIAPRSRFGEVVYAPSKRRTVLVQ
jgi:hypothetical protein